jgi:hypothetical protein
MAAFANPYYFSNPYSPYPPGCITTPQMQQALAGDRVAEVWSGTVELLQADLAGSLVYYDNSFIPMDLTVYRVGCAEPNRSVILLEFSIPDGALADERQFVLPEVVVLNDELHGDDNGRYPMLLAAEPNSWGAGPSADGVLEQHIGDFSTRQSGASGLRWVYVLDVPVPEPDWQDINADWHPDLALSSAAYNDTVKLLVTSAYEGTLITIPPTHEVLETRRGMELNGRLSGNWVVDGATDQGVMLSFSSIVGRPVAPLESPMLVFLSWYTFDAQGRMLWLTGSAEFQAGATEVWVPLVYVSNGQFMSSQGAFRRAAGSVRLAVRSCNSIQMDYGLSELGLGMGTQFLQRIFAMEIAGFPCRDFGARLADNVPDTTRRMQ